MVKNDLQNSYMEVQIKSLRVLLRKIIFCNFLYNCGTFGYKIAAHEMKNVQINI